MVFFSFIIYAMNKNINIEDNKYNFLKDEKIIGTIILITISIMQIFAFLRVPVLSSIHAYTVGMMLGNFNPFFYAFCAFFALSKIFPNKIHLPKWIKLSVMTYWFVVISLIFVVHSWYAHPSGISQIGAQPWKDEFPKWWKNFSDTKYAWAPRNYWGGLVGSFTWSFFTTFLSPIGSGIFASVMLALSLSLIITGSFIGLFKNLKNKKWKELKIKEASKDELKELVEEQEPINKIEELEKTQEMMLPFEDPFSDKDAKSDFKKINSKILEDAPESNNDKLEEEVKSNASKLQELFVTFKVDAQVSKTIVGPTLTKYIITPGPGINLKKFAQLEQNIKMALAAKEIRMELPIPGQSAIGVEVPNANPQIVSFKEVFAKLEEDFKDEPLAAVLGKNISGDPLVVPINKTPHLLVAGATGSGKSIGINAILMSLIMRTSPEDLRLVLIDPKMVEFMPYNAVPHLLDKVIIDPLKAAQALERIVEEMEDRFLKMSQTSTRNIEEYNAQTDEKLPYIVVVIDELADLMNVAAKLVEVSIQRITQKARAAGIHLIVATQRPSTDVVTGVIKANIPSRISFSVTSGVDSKVILDSVGAERLMGKGDMLLSLYGKGIERAQGAFISNKDIQTVIDEVKHLKAPKAFELFSKEEDENND